MKMFLAFVTLFLSLASYAQEIRYSKTVNEDLYHTNFQIIGKVAEHYMIYKRVRWKHMLAVYDHQMREIRNRRMSFMPDEASKVGFAISTDNIFIIYQYREANIIFCKAAKLDDEGKAVMQPFTLDSTVLLHESDRVSYHLTSSENKKRNLIYKAQVENEKLNFSFDVFDEEMNLVERTAERLPFDKSSDLYTQPSIDNLGSIIFTKGVLADTTQNVHFAKVTTASLLVKLINLQLVLRKLKSPGFTFIEVPLEGRSIGEVRVEIDNVNRRYVLNALFYDGGGNTQGLFTSFINPDDLSNAKLAFNAFNDVLRKTINPGSQLATAFNNLKLQDVTLKKNGGFIIAAEDTYIQLFRWPAYRTPTFIQNLNARPQSFEVSDPSKTYDFRPSFIRGYVPGQRTVLKSIVVVDIDSALQIKWNSVVNKHQSAEDQFVSYATYNTGSETHFIFSSHSEIKVVNNFSILPTGEFRKYSPLKTLASGYIFMPRYAKQVGTRQLIIPAYYRGTQAFVLVDFAKNYGYGN